MWIEVFKAGTHAASDGRKVTFDEGDIDAIVRKYNPAEHEAPVVIGHPKDNEPAFGWVEALKREGAKLFAKLKQLNPEFVEMLKTGLFKKRSISLYPDLTLRHIGFLGAVPPAVKGLADINFREGARFMTIEFGSPENKTGKRKAGLALEERVKAILENPPKYDRWGRPITQSLTYSEAFTIAQLEDLELAMEYAEEAGVLIINETIR